MNFANCKFPNIFYNFSCFLVHIYHDITHKLIINLTNFKLNISYLLL